MLVPTPTCVGLVTMFPPVAASYQVIIPPVAVAVNVCVDEPSVQTVWLPPLIGATGAGLMVKVTAVLVRLEQISLLDSA